MTKAQALAVLERRARYEPAMADVLAALKPKPRKARAGQTSALAKAAIKACDRPAFFGQLVPYRGPDERWINKPTPDERQQELYLDTFGPEDSPERAAQAARLKALPHFSQFSFEPPKASMKDDERAVLVLGFLNGPGKAREAVAA